MDMLKEDSMAKLTTKQIEFAKSMTNKQRAVLRTLDGFPFYLSASERCDRELDDLFRNRLVRACHYGIESRQERALPAWGVTEAGKLVVSMLKSGRI
jgi:hypothetical protein